MQYLLESVILHCNIPFMEIRPHSLGELDEQPRGKLASRALAMPADTNPQGDMFGGWIMSLMDAAGYMSAAEHAGGRVVTVAVSTIKFLAPVHAGDVICCYTNLERVGNTSITFHVEAWVLRQAQGNRTKVADAEFTFVAVDDTGKPRPLPRSVATL